MAGQRIRVQTIGKGTARRQHHEFTERKIHESIGSQEQRSGLIKVLSKAAGGKTPA